MRKTFALAILTLSALTLPMSANAAPCKDAKGKFIKCPVTAPATVKPTVAVIPAAAPAKPVGAVAAPKAAPCKDAKGKFVKCTTSVKKAPAAGPKKATCRDAKGRFKKC